MFYEVRPMPDGKFAVVITDRFGHETLDSTYTIRANAEERRELISRPRDRTEPIRNVQHVHLQRRTR